MPMPAVMAKKREILLGVGIFFAVSGACLLAGFGWRYLKPFLEVQTMVQGECTVIKSEKYGEEDKVICDCGQDSAASSCLSKYDCLKIWVNFTSVYGKSLTNLTLFDSYETLQLQGPTVLQCSYHKCDRIQSRNEAAVDSFKEDYGQPGQQYTCYYEPSSATYAVLRIVTLSTAVHVMVWPSLALIAGLTVVISYIFCTKPAPNNRHTYPSSSLDRVKNINRDNKYERVLTT